MAPASDSNGTPTNPDWLPESFPRKKPFLGFNPPVSNTTYTPNQFFDVCLPHNSRGVVRLVAYMLRKVLGWCDAEGNPQEEHILVSYADLVAKAGISREMIREAIDEAIAGGFIQCVRPGHADSRGSPAVSALYELRWDMSGTYVKNPHEFKGFFAQEGNRTDIPNQFFDEIIPNESLSVVKIVGSIIRFSIGFQSGVGRRRQIAHLSYDKIQDYAQIKNRSTLSQAIQQAVAANYIHRVRAGYFSPTRGQQAAAIYALRWIDADVFEMSNSKSQVHKSQSSSPTGQKNVPEKRSEKRTRSGQKNVPEKRSEKRTLEMKLVNETLKTKQQQSSPALAAAVLVPSLEKLTKAGFDHTTALRLATAYPPSQIENQVNWLGKRNPRKNPLGMLRKAIEENWPVPIELAPSSANLHLTKHTESPGAAFAAHFYAGYAGNKGRPTAEPSATEAETAGRYVERLAEVWPDPSQAAEWGRLFGVFFREKRGVQEGGPLPSLTLALRSFGDEFYQRHASRRARMLQDARYAAERAHEERFRADWLTYLRREEVRCKAGHRKAYQAFFSERQAERKSLTEGRWRSESALAVFDRDENRLTAFQQAFAEHDVLDFWDWDAAHNTAKFIPEAITV